MEGSRYSSQILPNPANALDSQEAVCSPGLVHVFKGVAHVSYSYLLNLTEEREVGGGVVQAGANDAEEQTHPQHPQRPWQELNPGPSSCEVR